jgi:hypothetical protein
MKDHARDNRGEPLLEKPEKGRTLYLVSESMWKSESSNTFLTEMWPTGHDRMFLRGLGSRVLELGGESGTDRYPTVYPGSYVECVQKLGYEAPGIFS